MESKSNLVKGFVENRAPSQKKPYCLSEIEPKIETLYFPRGPTGLLKKADQSQFPSESSPPPVPVFLNYMLHCGVATVSRID